MPRRRAPHRTHRPIGLWAVLATAVGVTAVVRPASAQVQRVAVLDLQADEAQRPLAAQLTALLLSSLARGGGVELRTAAHLRDTLSLEQIRALLRCAPDDPGCVLRLADRLGETSIVWGSLAREGDDVRLSLAAAGDGEALGLVSRTVAAGDDRALVDATVELAAELRILLGLQAPRRSTPRTIGAGVRLGAVLAGNVVHERTRPDALLGSAALEVDYHLGEAFPVYATAGISYGGGDDPVLLVPITVGARYRLVRDGTVPYAGGAVGVAYSRFDGGDGAAITAELVAGLELGMWNDLGVTIEMGIDFTHSFGGTPFTRLGGLLHLSAVYWF